MESTSQRRCDASPRRSTLHPSSSVPDKSAFFPAPPILSRLPPSSFSLSFHLNKNNASSPLLLPCSSPPPGGEGGSQTSLARDDIYAFTSWEKYRAMREPRASVSSGLSAFTRSDRQRERGGGEGGGGSSGGCFCPRALIKLQLKQPTRRNFPLLRVILSRSLWRWHARNTPPRAHPPRYRLIPQVSKIRASSDIFPPPFPPSLLTPSYHSYRIISDIGIAADSKCSNWLRGFLLIRYIIKFQQR